MELLSELKCRLSSLFMEEIIRLKHDLLLLLFINLRILAILVFNIVGLWLIFMALAWVI